MLAFQVREEEGEGVKTHRGGGQHRNLGLGTPRHSIPSAGLRRRGRRESAAQLSGEEDSRLRVQQVQSPCGWALCSEHGDSMKAGIGLCGPHGGPSTSPAHSRYSINFS